MRCFTARLGVLGLLLGITWTTLSGQWYAWSDFAKGGLAPKAEIQAMAQHPSGLLVLCTDMGLWVHDGQRAWRVAVETTSEWQGLAVCSSADRLYLGTRSGTLYSGPLEGPLLPLELEEGSPKAAITALCLDGEARLWMGTAGEGLYTLHEGRWYQSAQQDGLPSNWINALVSDGSWVYAATDDGLARVAFGEPKRRIEGPDAWDNLGPALSLVLQTNPDSAKNAVWAGLFDGSVVRWRVQQGPSKALRKFGVDSKGKPTSPVGSMALAAGQLWTGHEDGSMYTLGLGADRQTVLEPALFSGPLEPPRRVDQLLALKEGPMLAVCDRNRMLGWDPFVAAAMPESRAEIQALCALENGSLVYATLDGLFRLAPGASAPEAWRPSGLPEDAVIVRLHQDRNGALWMGSFDYGAFRWTEAEGLRALAEGGPQNVLDFAEGEDRMWMASFDGLWSLQGGARRVHAMPSSIGQNYVYSLCVDDQGRLWAGTDGDGVYAFRVDQGGQLDEKQHGLEGETVYSIVQDLEGRLWARTRNGQVLYWMADSNRWKPLASVPPADHELQALALDPDGHLLAVHESGMQHLSHPEQAPRALNIGPEHGSAKVLPQAVYYTEDQVWLGTDQGALRISGTLDGLPRAPRIHLRHALASGWPFAEGETIRADRRYIEFLISAPWHASGPASIYEYRLSGLEPEWRSTRDNRISFVRLPPGQYAFSVRARLGENGAPGPERRFQFSVRAPLWQRAWFILLLTALVFGALYAALSFREKRRLRIQEQEKERIQFRYETLRSQVNPHFLFNSFNTLSGLIEEHPGGAVDFVDRMARFYRQILAHRKESFIPLREEVAILEDYLGMLKARYESALDVKVDVPEQWQAHGILPLALQMLVENAIKHNRLTKGKPLPVFIFVNDSMDLGHPRVVVSNPIRPRSTVAPSTGLGLENLSRKLQLLALPELLIVKEGPAKQGDMEWAFQVSIPLVPPGRMTAELHQRNKTTNA